MKHLPVGKLLITTIAVATIVLPFIADYNATHIFNPNWSGHAKFHNAQAMTMGAVTGILAIWILWIKRGDEKFKLLVGMLLTTVYWAGQIGGAFFPGIAYFDVGSSEKAPIIFGVEFVQPYLAAIFILLVVFGYFLDASRLKKPNVATA